MSGELFEAFLESHPEWDDLLTKMAEEKARCQRAGEIDRISAWNKVEDLLYKEVEDLSIEWSDSLQFDDECDKRADIQRSSDFSEFDETNASSNMISDDSF